MMDLVDQFKVTLKDFWPDHLDATFINDRTNGQTTMISVSTRLSAEIRAYAKQKKLPLDYVIAQLRNEIHRCG